ncbi:plectin isoform X2 [Dunckerocampus dactyliophorus]|uniref:plectin isoform X2 n=1 Tax=Dunckerocampus dactyliophorus TaxID=161453 RepID=UPI002405A15A|nr:plectin isoform X2 [Dunckerocampus dactyliophorus]XP_054647434.1 plectin isoform X2 [Dunckerocampus dactyliophorus]XP_054647435.1 plectin isoform X2 [Dunckerocampus dactyliophorus]
MRRFFRAQRDEDYSQIQYLTAKCTRLARDKALSDREVLVSREREKKLQNDFQTAAAQLFHLEKTNSELRRTQEHLVATIHRQQELVESLQRRALLLVEESERDAELLRQVASELLCLQSTEVQLQGLVEELHVEARRAGKADDGLGAELDAEAHCRDALTESLLAELQRKTVELEELRVANKMLVEELKASRVAHEEQVKALQGQNESGVKKLQETLEQLERLCQQQRYWMAHIRRFKDRLMEEREALLQQVRTLEREAGDRKKSRDRCRQKTQRRPLQDAGSHRGVSSWDADEEAELDPEEMTPQITDDEAHRVKEAGSPVNRYQKPP